MNKIAILIPSLKPGGAEKQASLLALVLSEFYLVDIYLLYGDTDASAENLKILNAPNIQIHSLKGNILSKIKQLTQKLRVHQPLALFNYLTSCDVVGAIAGHLAKVDKIYNGVRNARVEWRKMIADKIVHNHIASGTIFNCYSGAEYFSLKGFNKKKNIIIPNCFMNIANPIVRDDRAVKHIVSVGRFVRQKDYLTMIRAISFLRNMRGDFKLDIIGYGEEEQNIRKWVDEYDINDYVNIYIRPNNVQDIVQKSDIYISTSLFEGTSNSIMEALNWSLPVVATDVGDNNCLVKHGDNGMLHKIGDAESIAQSLSVLLDSIELRNKYGLRSNQNLRDNYSMDIFQKRYIEIINS